MKKILLIISCIIFGSCGSKTKISNSAVNRGVDSTKTNTYVVEYDFLKGHYDRNALKAKVGKPIVYKIKNINQLAYEVKVTVKDSVISKSSWDNEIQEIIKEFRELPSVQEMERQRFLGLTDSDNFIETTQSENNDNVKNIIDTISKRENLNKAISKISVEISKAEEDLAKIENDIQNKVIDINDKIHFTELNNKKEKLDFFIQEKSEELGIKQKQLIDLNDVFKGLDSYFKEYITEKEKFENTFYELQTIYNDLLEVNYCAHRIAELSFHPFLTEQKFETQYKNELDLMSLRFPVLLSQYKKFADIYRELNYHYANLKGNKKDLNDVLVSGGSFKFLYNLEKMKQSADNMDNEIRKIDPENLLDKLSKVLQLLNNSHNYEFISGPVQPLYDVVIFNVDIKKRNKNGYEVLKEKKFNHKEYLRYGLRYDLSIGAAGSLHSRKYNYSLEVNSIDQQVITLKSDKIFSPSFVGFFTTSYRSSTHWTFGLSVGLGIGADEGTFSFDNFFVGPSLILGRYERVMLSMGIALKDLPTLKESYSEGDIVPNSFILENVTNNSYRLGYFISLSYNLTKGVKDNIKQFRSSM